MVKFYISDYFKLHLHHSFSVLIIRDKYGQLISGVQVCTIANDAATQINMASPVQWKFVSDELIDKPPLTLDSDEDYSPTDSPHDNYVNTVTLFSCDDWVLRMVLHVY